MMLGLLPELTVVEPSGKLQSIRLEDEPWKELPSSAPITGAPWNHCRAVLVPGTVFEASTLASLATLAESTSEEMNARRSQS